MKMLMTSDSKGQSYFVFACTVFYSLVGVIFAAMHTWHILQSGWPWPTKLIGLCAVMIGIFGILGVIWWLWLIEHRMTVAAEEGKR